jgi:4-amino-4-deoxy-L-arabinose transferase-like glycosyltransferase
MGHRMRRRLFTLVSAVSLVLCVATCVLWVRSYYATVEVSAVAIPGVGQWDLKWQEGEMQARDARYDADYDAFLYERKRLRELAERLSAELRMLAELPTMPDEGDSEYCEKANRYAKTLDLYDGLSGNGPMWKDYSHGEFRLWQVTAAKAVLPSVWITAWFVRLRWRRKRLASSLCSRCGYDLRASPGRCPECGAEPKGATA